MFENPAETYKSLALEMDKNNTLSTLEILGMYAETKAEKRKYARKFSKLFYQYTDRVLGFQTLIRQANKDFYGNPSMFDYVGKFTRIFAFFCFCFGIHA
jgi:hypothetical protein